MKRIVIIIFLLHKIQLIHIVIMLIIHWKEKLFLLEIEYLQHIQISHLVQFHSMENCQRLL